MPNTTQTRHAIKCAGLHRAEMKALEQALCVKFQSGISESTIQGWRDASVQGQESNYHIHIGIDFCTVILRLSEGLHRDVHALVETSDPVMLDRLVRMTIRSARKERELQLRTDDFTDYMEQLTYDLEEQAWLRKLNEQLKLCDAGRGVDNVVKELMGSLQGLLQSEGMGVLIASNGEKGHCAVAINHWLGDLKLDATVWQAWFGPLACRAGKDPIIRNGDHVEPILAVQGVQSLLAVPVVTSTDGQTWMVALNRNPTPDSLEAIQL